MDARRVVSTNHGAVVPSLSVLDYAMPIRNEDVPPVLQEENDDLPPFWGFGPGFYDRL